MSELATAYAELVEGFRGSRNTRENPVSVVVPRAAAAAKAANQNAGVIAALKRCATPNRATAKAKMLHRYLPNASLFTTYGILVMSPP